MKLQKGYNTKEEQDKNTTTVSYGKDRQSQLIRWLWIINKILIYWKKENVKEHWTKIQMKAYA